MLKRPLSRVPFRWLEVYVPITLRAWPCKMGTLGNGCCFFKGEIKSCNVEWTKRSRRHDHGFHEIPRCRTRDVRQVLKSQGVFCCFYYHSEISTLWSTLLVSLKNLAADFELPTSAGPQQASQGHFWLELHGPCQMWIRWRGRAHRSSWSVRCGITYAPSQRVSKLFVPSLRTLLLLYSVNYENPDCSFYLTVSMSQKTSLLPSCKVYLMAPSSKKSCRVPV